MMSWEEFERNCKCDKGQGNVDISEDTKCRIHGKLLPWINEIDDNYISKTYL